MGKKILTVYTGGTICTAPTEHGRELSPALAKRALLLNFARSDSLWAKYCEELFEDSCLEGEYQTLSENMTLSKLDKIIAHIRKFDLDDYRGVIILHGTDTLAFSAALLSFVFSDTPVPIMIVSGNRPPMDLSSNATANFCAATELIMSGVSPNVYVPYRNSDGKLYVHLGSAIMQSPNYSEDFFSAPNGRFLLGDGELFKRCKELSSKRMAVDIPKHLTSKALLLQPYTGLDYSCISLDGVCGVIHGSYHSGTVCVERNSQDEGYSTSSILYFAAKCAKANIPLFVAPSRLDSEQYSSVYDLCKSTDTVLLDMTSEAAYAKLVLGISKEIYAEDLRKFMLCAINNEFSH